MQATGLPLVSCIMPTFNRRAFVPTAIRFFLRQDYEPKELIIVDDGTDPVGDLLPVHPAVRYIRLDRRPTVGAKRNLACEQARGEIIAHWDDDDWHAPHRLPYQVEALLCQQRQMCGLQHLYFYDVGDERAWEYVYPAHHGRWLSGSSLVYHRAFWAAHRFADLDVGEDGRFVAAAPGEALLVLPDPSFHVGLIHGHNVSPKYTGSSFWRPLPVETLRAMLGDDWAFWNDMLKCRDTDNRRTEGEQAMSLSVNPLPPPCPTPIRNLYACLVHESRDCIADLVRNLHALDPVSAILLYNGSKDTALLDPDFPYQRYNAAVHPRPRPQAWGQLHSFALDCMQFALESLDFDTMTIVDSDQLAVRADYSTYLARYLAAQPGAGLLGNSPQRQPPTTRVGPAVAAWREIDLWRPFLRRFPFGEDRFVHWSFWPGTVFSADAARDLVRLFHADEQLQDILSHSRIWATEEVLFPTLAALLGHKIAAHPCSYDYITYRVPYTSAQLNEAMARPDVYWVHPINRRYADPLRRHVRAHFLEYQSEARPGAAAARRPLPIAGAAVLAPTAPGNGAAPHPAPAAPQVDPPIRNVYACLVHESFECVVDLVANLHALDPESTILLYNGGSDIRLLEPRELFEHYGGVIYPRPRRQVWGNLHTFAVDCMQFALENLPFDALTIVDSDQLAVRPGYAHYLARYLAGHPGAGLLGNSPEPQAPTTHLEPAQAAFREIDLWRPFLRRFPDGERKFVHWSFWPGTVFTADVARDLVRLFTGDEQLQGILAQSKMWATEEILFPTLAALLGHTIAAHPCSYDLVRPNGPYTPAQIDVALARPDIYWVHPVKREYADPLRRHIRARFSEYALVPTRVAPGPFPVRAGEIGIPPPLRTLPILACMRPIPGWLDEVEADVLIAATTQALLAAPGPHTVVEVGSYCGRATVVLGRVVQALSQGGRVYAIDPYDGRVGALDQQIYTGPPTLEPFRRAIAAAGLDGLVESVQACAPEVAWERPIHLLLIDHFHDYTSVSRDFAHFERWMAPGGYAAFHDYADYFPGVKTFVGELLASGKYREVQRVGTMMVVEKR